MSVLKANFNYNVEQNPKTTDDYLLKRTHGENGEEITIESKVNYKEIQESNGTADLWDLQRMKQAGIDVSRMTPHTSNPTREEGLDAVKDAANNFIERVEADVKKAIKNKETIL